MNIITATHAVAFYPRLTLVEGVNIACDTGPLNGGIVDGRHKYTQRGWTLINAAKDVTEHQLALGSIRVVGDKKCWSVRHTAGSEETISRHSWSPGIAEDGREIVMSFSNVMEHEMTRWVCVEGSIHFIMCSSSIHW